MSGVYPWVAGYSQKSTRRYTPDIHYLTLTHLGHSYPYLTQVTPNPTQVSSNPTSLWCSGIEEIVTSDCCYH